MPRIRRIALLSAMVWLMVPCLNRPVTAQTPAMVEFFAGGKLRKGLPLVDLSHEMIVVSQDGWMHSIDPRSSEVNIRRIEETFHPASAVQLRNDLRAEFGRNYEVASTKNFVVVQPAGRGDRWPKLFESSHRNFITYMGRHGVKIRQGRFPMVAVVLPDQRAMYMEFKKLDIDMTRVSGIYSGESNRVMTHDGGRLSYIAATVRHEAAHQSAFNSGVHSRVNDTPRWITEGVGQMFEPPAMVDSLGATRLSDRVHRDSTVFIDGKQKNRNDVWLSQIVMQLVSDDTMFASHDQIADAYAVSWAMMFYLAERQPKAFADILNHTAARAPFQNYDRSARVRDFERIVGTDTFEFSKRVSWFLDSL
jgi:hypothetical protein